MKNFFISLSLFLLPTGVCRIVFLLFKIKTVQIGKKCHIGFSWLNCSKLVLKDSSYIGHFNYIHNKELLLGGGKIKHLNMIKGNFSLIMENGAWINSQNKIASNWASSDHPKIMYMKSNAAIIMKHTFDLTDSITIGEGTLFAVFVSYEFHNSALLMLVVLALWVVRTQKFNYLITIAMATTVYLSISLILPLLIYSPLFKEGFAEHYINTGVETAKSNISIAMCTLLYGIMLLFSKYKVEKVQNYMLIVCSIYTLVFLFLADYFEVAFRASYYFFIIVLLLVPMSIKREKNENIKNLLQLGYLILYIISFYVDYTHGLSGAAEYESIAIL